MNFNAQEAWSALRQELISRAVMTDFLNNPRLDPVTMALHAEYRDLLRKMAELDGTDGEQHQ